MLNITSILFRLAVLALALGFPVTILAQTAPPEIPLWPKGAPGFEDRRNEPEQAEDYWVRHINNPSITVYLPPKDKATGAAVVICPGGGHRELVFNAEGRQPAQYLNSIGVAAFVLKYRLASEVNSPYSLDKHTREDAYRAMRLVRSKADEFGIDPNRLGMLGFSAGGDVVSLVAYTPGKGPSDALIPLVGWMEGPPFRC
ncbi:alpha/beta hydrolase [Spirosoma lituiforme]